MTEAYCTACRRHGHTLVAHQDPKEAREQIAAAQQRGDANGARAWAIVATNLERRARVAS